MKQSRKCAYGGFCSSKVNNRDSVNLWPIITSVCPIATQAFIMGCLKQGIQGSFKGASDRCCVCHSSHIIVERNGKPGMCLKHIFYSPWANFFSHQCLLQPFNVRLFGMQIVTHIPAYTEPRRKFWLHYPSDTHYFIYSYKKIITQQSNIALVGPHGYYRSMMHLQKIP